MQSKNIGYHTRLYSDHNVKVVGGSFGGQVDQETIERLTRLFTVVIKPSGTPVFVDREGREVRLYITVDPASTNIGKKAVLEYNEKRRAESAKALETAQEEEINSLMQGMSHEEILRRLKG